MKNLFVSVAIILFATTCFAAEITNLWGVVSFRERQEEEKLYYSTPGSDIFGDPWQIRTNTKTRFGYKFGMNLKISEYLSAGLTFRSGIKSVMWQDIDNKNGLTPGIQEAYLDWKVPFFDVQLGKVPQQGNAIWDVYAGHNQTDFRTDDPRDGIFADRMSALNGVRLTTEAGPISLRGVYHIDYVAGNRIEFVGSSSDDKNNPDKYVYMFGGALSMSDLMSEYMTGLNLRDDFHFDVEGDYGFPYRSANFYLATDDSVFFDEDIWGAGLSTGFEWVEFEAQYAYNWREQYFTSRFWDYKLQIGAPENMLPELLSDLRLTVNYEYHSQQQSVGQFKDTRAVRDALHLYLNKKIWDLDIQPRIIWFKTEIDGIKTNTNVRMELTTTTRFDL